MWKIETAQLVKDAINKDCRTKITVEDICRKMQPINVITSSSCNIFAIQRGNITILVQIEFNGQEVNILDVKEIEWQ